MLERDPLQLTPLVETIAGDTSVGHAWAYCAAVEALTDCKLDDEVEFARALMLELERVAMHLAALSGLAADIAFLQGATTYGRLRTTAINASMRLCGSRFGRSALRPGGVRLRPPESTLEGLFESLKLLQRDLEPMRDLFLSARTVQHRLKGVGVLSAQRAQELGMVGLAARASDVAIDTRSAPRGGAYQLEPLAPVVHPDGDCWARACVRIGELEASLDWLERVIRRHAKWDQPRRAPGRLAPNQLAVTLIEGFRGEVMHCVETNDQGRLLHYKVQDPSLRNWMGLALAVRGNEISDFPICNKSFDLSYCGHDL
ncbi:MAG TPA: hypothetical protein VHB79_25150 [Polyangiaceae bacterium]|nr:hypothetical protein [Polyangiaceae bacterium]